MPDPNQIIAPVNIPAPVVIVAPVVMGSRGPKGDKGDPGVTQDVSGLMPKSGGTFEGGVSMSGQTLNLDGGTLSGGSIGFDFSGATSANLFSAIFQTATTLTMGAGMGNALWTAMGGGGTIELPTFGGAAGQGFTVSVTGGFPMWNIVSGYVALVGCRGQFGGFAGNTWSPWFAVANNSAYAFYSGSNVASYSLTAAFAYEGTANTVGLYGATKAAGPTGNLKLGNLIASGTLTLGSQTVGTLPAASASNRARIEVTDALSPVEGSAVVGGGSTACTVRSDGTIWKVTEIL